MLNLIPSGVSDYFYTGADPKGLQGIVLHHTAGYLKGDLGTLVQTGNHVCVPYVVSRDGNIYHLFDESKYWAYHLGAGAVGGNTVLSKKTIAIEMSNIGSLTLSGDNLLTGYGDKYCGVADKHYYSVLPTEFRGSRYYASYTAEQVAAVRDLVKYLSTRYGIPLTQLDNGKAYQTFKTDAEALAWKGLSSHINYRATGKTDVGPVFPWYELA